MRLYFLLTFFLFGFSNCKTKKVIVSNPFLSAQKVVLEENLPEQFHYWEMENSPQLWQSNSSEVSGIDNYRSSLIKALGKQGFENAVANEATQAMDKELITSAEDGDRFNALLVHTNTVGSIRPINFLEAQILNYQLSRYPLFDQPTEFHGFIAVHVPTKKVRVYFAGSDTEWPPQPHIIIDELETLKEKGWKLKYHLHNHYCKADKNYVGILAPSMSDAEYFKMLAERFNLPVALITNGFHTVEIKQTAFKQFKAYNSGG